MAGDLFRLFRSRIRIYFFARSRYIKARMADPYSFLIHVFCDLIIQVLGIVFYVALFEHIDQIRGWEFHDVLLIYGIAQLSYGWFGLLFSGLYDLGSIVAGGAFDIYLSRPLSSLFQLHLRGLGDIGGVLTGGITIVYLLLCGAVHPSFGNILVLLLAPLLGGVLYAGLFSIIGAMNFRYLHASSGLLSFLGDLIAFGRYPITIYPRFLQLALTWVVPIAFTGFYPAAFITGSAWKTHLLALPIVVAVEIALVGMIWRWGVKRYESTGN